MTTMGSLASEAGWPIIRTRFELASSECRFRRSAKYIYIHISTHINYTNKHTHNKDIQDKPYVQAYTPSPTVLRFAYVLRLSSIAQKHTEEFVYPSVCSVISHTEVSTILTPYSMEHSPA